MFLDSYSWVWKHEGPEKYHFFIWLVLHQSFLMASLRHQCGLAASDRCSQCLETARDALHCLCGFRDSKNLWCALGFGYSLLFFHSDLDTWLQYYLRDTSSVLFFVALWWCWRWKNQQILFNDNWSLQHVLCII